MKILNSDQIRWADAHTIKNEPISSVELMERAAGVCFQWLKEHIEFEGGCCHIFCGKGNNGGDGLVLARLLNEEGVRVKVYLVHFTEHGSDDFQTNLDRLDRNKIEVLDLKKDEFDLPFASRDLIIDAIFGNGLSRPPSGWVKEVIRHINAIPLMKISIDLPSGLFSEYNDTNDPEAIVKADITLTFQHPKLCMLLEQSGIHCGEWEVLDIGLNEAFIETLDSPFHAIHEDDVWLKLKEREKFAHKGNFGHALLIAGSKGKMGASVLSGMACLRSGIGLLTFLTPECGYQILQSTVPEGMCLTSTGQEVLSDLPKDLSPYNVVGVGPGIGQSEETGKALHELLNRTSVSMVIDADALNLLAANNSWLERLKPNSILTPHPGEFHRLVGSWNSDREKLEKLIEFSKKYKVITVLKGGHTAICSPEGKVYFNTTGNPGMATGGSGDVLTGMITGLLGRGYEVLDAAIIGVYLHGLAGDVAEEENGEESMTAMDIVNNISAAFNILS